MSWTGLYGRECPHCHAVITQEHKVSLVEVGEETGLVRSELWHWSCILDVYPMRLFTEQETRVALLVVNGRYLSGIAKDIGISVSSVKGKVSNMKKKAGVSNRVKLALFIKNARAPKLAVAA